MTNRKKDILEDREDIEKCLNELGITRIDMKLSENDSLKVDESTTSTVQLLFDKNMTLKDRKDYVEIIMNMVSSFNIQNEYISKAGYNIFINQYTKENTNKLLDIYHINFIFEGYTSILLRFENKAYQYHNKLITKSDSEISNFVAMRTFLNKFYYDIKL